MSGRRRGRAAFWLALAAGLVIRLAILSQTAQLGPRIVDEQDYVALATNVLEHQTFASAEGRPTSIRPPLYPVMVALVWRVTSAGNYQAVRIVQVILAALTVLVVYRLGRSAFGEPTGAIAAAVVWLYPSLIFFNITLLTETLYTFLFIVFVALAVRLATGVRGSGLDPSAALRTGARGSGLIDTGSGVETSISRESLIALACGVTLGLATLTRSVLWPLPVVLCPLLAIAIRGSWARRIVLPAIVLAGFVVTLAPWAIRNTRLQGVVTIVDTMGGINLRMGNYEYTPEDRMWDAVSLKGDRNWVHGLDVGPNPTEGQKEKWAQRKALDYMRANPGTTLRRAVIKFCDFWGLEREFVAGVQGRLYSPPSWFVWTAAALTALGCVLVMVGGAAGMWLAAPAWRAHALLLLPTLAIVGAHTIVFGHSRYHIPLVPILALYGAGLLAELVLSRPWAARATPRRPAAVLWLGAGLTTALLAGIWARELLFVEAPRLRAFWHSLL